jgi:hypothetical protein
MMERKSSYLDQEIRVQPSRATSIGATASFLLFHLDIKIFRHRSKGVTSV